MIESDKMFNNNDEDAMVEARNLKKHLGLSEKSFVTLSEKEQAEIGGWLKELLYTLTDGALVPLLNLCLEECHVRKLCALKGIMTDELSSSSQLKVEDVKKEEPKEEPEDEPMEEPIDSDVDERMAEADADIEAQVLNRRNKGHGNDKEESECLDCGKIFKSKGSLYGHRREKHSDATEVHTCPECGKKFGRKGNLKVRYNANTTNKILRGCYREFLWKKYDYTVR